MNFERIIVLLGVCSMSMGVQAETYTSQYAGQAHREIKSLSASDIEHLSSGAGWGLARAAELNGLPGPAHILEMEEEIALSAEQKREIKKLFDDMRTEAIGLGKQLIDLEAELDAALASRRIDRASLQTLVQRIGEIRAELRFVHLSTHLKTPDILTEDQIARYNQLRGYSQDPCTNIPAGHDEEMWRRHNGCDDSKF